MAAADAAEAARGGRPAPFAGGEELRFELSWLGIVAGTATMRVEPPTSFAGTPAYRLSTRAVSTPFFSRIFPVDDRLVSWIDARRFRSLRFEKHLREGRKRSHELVDFDPAQELARFEGRAVPTPPDVLDTLSAFYFVRTLRLEPGTSERLDVHAGGKNYGLRVDVLSRERIATPFGDRAALKIEPHQEYEGVFAQRGRVWIWLSDDANRLPLLLRSSLPIGAITARLVDYRVTPTPGVAAPPIGAAGGG
ncbi:MAG TPA: DUF3108 domain-containing protein [Thermoanaerobaculia bacterium]|nr:DUF3108 domain-containing protein [Thermoanaerobaculia bacterium]